MPERRPLRLPLTFSRHQLRQLETVWRAALRLAICRAATALTKAS